MESTEPECISLKNFKKWTYRGEGNANLVISLPEEKLILRMQKCEYSTVLTKTIVEEREMKIKKDIKFYVQIMMPFIGRDFIRAPILARLHKDEINDIDNALYAFRPKFRLNKGIRFDLITVHPDYSHLPISPVLTHNLRIAQCQSYSPDDCDTFCIEIKPKQGWTPVYDRQYQKCTFCMNQYLKYKNERVSRISRYCPLDLFSGNHARMKRALKSLLKTPQNNLKIFHNGNIVFGEESNKDCVDVLRSFIKPEKDLISREGLIEKWTGLILRALLCEPYETATSNSIFALDEIIDVNDELNTCENAHFSGTMLEPCDWSMEPLPPNCILNRILLIQKLQVTSFKTVYKMYRERCLTEGDYDYVDKLLKFPSSLDEIQSYLLSATAKDCSVFVAMQKVTNGMNENVGNCIKDYDGSLYRFNIGISDIDPKPLSCIGKHFNRDKEILSAILETAELVL